MDDTSERSYTWVLGWFFTALVLFYVVTSFMTVISGLNAKAEWDVAEIAARNNGTTLATAEVKEVYTTQNWKSLGHQCFAKVVPTGANSSDAIKILVRSPCPYEAVGTQVTLLPSVTKPQMFLREYRPNVSRDTIVSFFIEFGLLFFVGYLKMVSIKMRRKSGQQDI